MYSQDDQMEPHHHRHYHQKRESRKKLPVLGRVLVGQQAYWAQ